MFVGYVVHILDNHENAKSAYLPVLHRYGEIRKFPFQRVVGYTTIVETQRDTLFIADDFHIDIVGMRIVHNIEHDLFYHHAEQTPTVGYRHHLLCLENGFNDVECLALDLLATNSSRSSFLRVSFLLSTFTNLMAEASPIILRVL